MWATYRQHPIRYSLESRLTTDAGKTVSCAQGEAPRTLNRSIGIGQNLSNAVTGELIRVAKYARDQLTGTPPKIILKGVIQAEITAIATQADAYDQANWAQSQAQQTASALLQDLRTLVEAQINPLRRELQLTADMAYPHRVETNAAQRKAFGLQVDRPLA